MNSSFSEEEIFSIFRTPLRFRTAKQVQSLMVFTESVKFFKRLTEEHNSSLIHEKCCEVMTLEEYSESDIIINFGEVGDKFYVILKGSVVVMIPSIDVIKVPVSEAEKYKVRQSTPENSSDYDSSEELDTIVLPSKKERRDGIPVASVSQIINTLKIERKSLIRKKNENEEVTVARLFIDKFRQEKKEIVKIIRECENEYIEIEVSKLEAVDVMKQGSSFGELALLSNQPRAATIIANERVALLVINKVQFRKILENIATDRVFSKVRFFQGLSFFTSWTKSAISKISAYFDSATFQRNQVIFAEGQEVKEVFIIRSGEVLLTKIQRRSISPNSLRKNQKVLTKNRELQICIKGKCEIVGGYEVAYSLDTRVFGVVCYSSKAEVFVIKKDNFINKIPLFDNIREGIIKDNQRIDERLKELSSHDPYEEVYKKILTKSPSPFRYSKENLLLGLKLDKKYIKYYSKDSQRRLDKTLSRKLTPAEISRALNPQKSLRIAVKPIAVKYRTPHRTPPPNFMFKPREPRLQALFKKISGRLTSREL